MSTIISRIARATMAATALFLLASCGEDTIVSPVFGSECQAGSLAPGDTVLGQFTPSSCFMDFDFWSYEHAPFVGYSVHLTQGHAYMIRLDSLPDTTYNFFDSRLTLWTKNADGSSIPLALSDDDAGFHNSVLWFVAPVSGTFELVAASYWYGGLGNYRLTMNECPVLGALDTAGTYNFTLGPSPCVSPNAGDNNVDTAAYSFLTLQADAGEGIDASVTTSAFPPVWAAFGPGFDVFSNVYQDSRADYNKGSGNDVSFTMGNVGGQVTLAVGATTVDSTAGAFSITLGRTPPAAPPAPGSKWSLAKVAQMTMRPKPATKTH